MKNSNNSELELLLIKLHWNIFCTQKDSLKRISTFWTPIIIFKNYFPCTPYDTFHSNLKRRQTHLGENSPEVDSTRIKTNSKWLVFLEGEELQRSNMDNGTYSITTCPALDLYFSENSMLKFAVFVKKKHYRTLGESLFQRNKSE
jgi:hypothetical protein